MFSSGVLFHIRIRLHPCQECRRREDLPLKYPYPDHYQVAKPPPTVSTSILQGSRLSCRQVPNMHKDWTAKMETCSFSRMHFSPRSQPTLTTKLLNTSGVQRSYSACVQCKTMIFMMSWLPGGGEFISRIITVLSYSLPLYLRLLPICTASWLVSACSS